MVMAKKLKEVEIPVSVNGFTKQEIDYINNASKKVPYKVDVKLAQILIPPDHFAMASEDLHVMHLVNKFKFSVQSTIGAEYIPVKDEPIVFTDKKELITEGLNFRNKAKAVFQVIGVDSFGTVTYVNDREAKKEIPKNELLSKIKKGFYVILR